MNTKITIGSIIIAIILLIIISLYSNDKITNYQGNLDKCIGKAIVINKDTLEIIDYSLLNNTFILSNGSNVNTKYVLNKLKYE